MLTVLLERKTEKGNSGTASVNTDRQWSQQETYFACETPVWLGVIHNTSAFSGECIRHSNRIARASELGSC